MPFFEIRQLLFSMWLYIVLTYVLSLYIFFERYCSQIKFGGRSFSSKGLTLLLLSSAAGGWNVGWGACHHGRLRNAAKIHRALLPGNT